MRKWQRVLIAIVACGTLAVEAWSAAALANENDADQVKGSWYITVSLTDPF
jgi:hypothetical protein